MGGSSFFEIIILGMIAVFLVLRLRSVLGRRTGHEQERQKPLNGAGDTAKPDGADKVVALPSRAADIGGDAAPGIASGITQIKIADPSFDPRGFVKGAQTAFQMIVNAFAAGDTATLRPLLSDDLYDEFSEAIRKRLAAGETLENRIEAIKSADLVEADIEGRTAFVTIRFVSSQIHVTRDAEGEVIDGEPESTQEVTDLWTFSRNTRVTDPNWSLVKTEVPS
ncbi:MAG: Tim44 domain-containing protein [Inquilinus sp.]|nr:Tim44 domain-containing protein [Inquilinus sp.]